jgi:hypothetical protein
MSPARIRYTLLFGILAQTTNVCRTRAIVTDFWGKAGGS